MEKQFREKRRILIEQLKLVREERLTLKGVSGTGARWNELTGEMVELQRQVDFLSKSMGLPVKTNHHQQPKGSPRGVPYNQIKKQQVAAGRKNSKE